jgi:hypothetical protein
VSSTILTAVNGRMNPRPGADVLSALREDYSEAPGRFLTTRLSRQAPTNDDGFEMCTVVLVVMMNCPCRLSRFYTACACLRLHLRAPAPPS